MGKNSSTVIGYSYFGGAHLILTEGPVDEITRFIYGERDAYVYDPLAPSYPPSGYDPETYDWPDQIRQPYRLNTNTTVTVRASQLMGGEKREGGVRGDMTVSMGTSTTPDPYLQQHIAADVPAYIGVTSVIFKDFMWSSMNPYFKAPWFETIRLRTNWKNGNIWYESKLRINSMDDFNPIHIIYQCITEDTFGMGYPTADINDTNFRAAADKLYAEGFGMSLIWDQDLTVEDFIQVVLSTINADLRLDMTTGQFIIKLFRDDYVVNDLLVVDPDRIIALRSFQRTGWGELANEITVMYTDRNQDQQPVTVQDLAAIENQGSVVSSTKEYLGVREEALAMRLAMRDLALSSATLAKVSLTVDRSMWAFEKGDVFAFSWPRLGIVKAPFRIVEIDKGNINDGIIEIEAVEDVFGLPNNSYMGVQPNEWVDPSGPPDVPLAQRVDEVNFRDIARYVPRSQRDTFSPTYCFARVAAISKPGVYFSFDLTYRHVSSGIFDEVATGHFCPTATLVNELDYMTDTMTLTDIVNPGGISPGTYALIDNEMVVINSVDQSTWVVQIGRGVIDSVPDKHSAGARVWFPETRNAVDPTERLPETTAYYKVLPTTGQGTLAQSLATPISITFASRAQRPYAPGQFKLNGEYYPEYIHGQLAITWAHRNRLTQADVLVPTTAPSINPEDGTDYLITILGEDNQEVFNSSAPGSGFTLTRDVEYESDVYAGSDMRDMRIVNISISASPAEPNLRYKDVVYIVGGWARSTFGNVWTAEYIDGTTGAVTNASRSDFTTYTRQQLFTPKAGVYVGIYDYGPYNSIAYYDPYIGYAITAVAGFAAANIGYASDAITGSVMIRDRRPAARSLVQVTTRNAILEYQAIDFSNRRSIVHHQVRVHNVLKSAITSNSLASTSFQLTDMHFANTAQFENASGQYGIYQPPFSGRTNTYGTFSNYDTYRRIAIIFGSLLYLPRATAGATYSTAGRAMDITNILTAHLSITTSLVEQTALYSIDLDGNITFIANRTGLVFADQVSATTGVECVGGSIWTVNSSTGVLGPLIVTLPSSSQVMRVVGDLSSDTFYVLANNYKVYRYDLSGTLIAELQLPDRYTPFVPQWMVGVTSPFQMEVTQGYVYVFPTLDFQGEGVTTYRMEKNLSVYKEMRLAQIDSGINAYSRLISSRYDSPEFYITRLLDETGTGVQSSTFPKPRLNDTLTVEVKAVVGELESHQKHHFVTKRKGWGMRWGRSWGGGS